MPSPVPPPINPAIHGLIGPGALAPLFPTSIIEQEASTKRYIPIPDDVRVAMASVQKVN